MATKKEAQKALALQQATQADEYARRKMGIPLFGGIPLLKRLEFYAIRREKLRKIRAAAAEQRQRAW